MVKKERIDKTISSQTMLSRREIHKLIKGSSVRVNGIICKAVDMKINPYSDVIEVDGKRIEYKKYVYYMMNKPAGVLSASSDKRAQTVIDLLPDDYKRPGLFPAGRLDKDTEGLLIITDDGDFAHKMLSPSKKVYKHYIAVLDKELTEDVKRKFEEGIVFEDGTVCKKAFLEILGRNKALVKICEGKFHQVKKMFAACSLNVLRLKRVQIGQLSLDSTLSLSNVRELSAEERLKIFEN